MNTVQTIAWWGGFSAGLFIGVTFIMGTIAGHTVRRNLNSQREEGP